MLTVEVRVNGTLLTHTEIVNQMVTHGNAMLYRIHHYDAESHKVTATQVMHCPDDGAERLVEIAMDKVRQEALRDDAGDSG